MDPATRASPERLGSRRSNATAITDEVELSNVRRRANGSDPKHKPRPYLRFIPRCARYGGFLRAPELEVTVLRRIVVNGEVRMPSVYMVDVTLSLRDAIAQRVTPGLYP